MYIIYNVKHEKVGQRDTLAEAREAIKGTSNYIKFSKEAVKQENAK